MWNLKTYAELERFRGKVRAQFKTRETVLSCAEIAETLRAKQIQVRRVLNELITSQVLVASGNTRNTRYSLK